jgi:hypothetical protein
VEGHRLRLHRFRTQAAAEDFDAVDGAISGQPMRTYAHRGRTRRVGCTVIESDPPVRYADPANVVPLPDDAIDWWPLLELLDLNVSPVGAHGADKAGGEPRFLDLTRALRLSGFEVLHEAFLPPGQLRVGCSDGMAMTIEGDPFLVYLFERAEDAARYAESQTASIAAGPFVLRSSPTDMYVFPGEVLYAGDDQIRWSTLPSAPAFQRAAERVVAASDG